MATSENGRVGTRDRAGFARLFRVRDFVVLWVAGAQSTLGDQLARVALSVLVFDRTGSNLATAATYALTLLPSVVGGLTLSSLADVLPRRSLLIACDVARSGLFALMAIPAMPLAALEVFLVLAVLCGSPYNAAEPSLVADIFDGDDYVAANGLRTATSQAAQLIGFAFGGVVVALVGTHSALLVNAITFGVSAVLIRVWLSYRAPAREHETGMRLPRIGDGLRIIVEHPRLRALMLFTVLIGWWVVPEGLAAPYAARHAGGAIAVGMLLAAGPVGNLIGVVVITRWVPSTLRPKLLPVLAVGAGVPLMVCALDPALVIAVVLWAVSGALCSYVVLVITEFVALVPTTERGQLIGIASSSLLATQGLGLLVGGLIAAWTDAARAIAICGAAGFVCALTVAVLASRSSRDAEIPLHEQRGSDIAEQ